MKVLLLVCFACTLLVSPVTVAKSTMQDDPASQDETEMSPQKQVVPLMDLGTRLYLGKFEGGLYEGGVNTPPPDQDEGLRKAASQVQPIKGKNVVVSIGMSNWTDEMCCQSETFIAQAQANPNVNHKTLALVDCAQSGVDARRWANPNDQAWTICRNRLAHVGRGFNDVQVILWKDADLSPVQPMKTLNGHCTLLSPQDYCLYARDVGVVARYIKQHMPNIKMMFLHSRIYAGYGTGVNPEPFAYEYGFSTRYVIESQIAQERGGQPDPNVGDVSLSAAPIMAWGPYFWADGTIPRSDGLIWCNGQVEAPCNGEQDFQRDGIHPSTYGIQKVAGMLMNFYLASPYAPWFRP